MAIYDQYRILTRTGVILKIIGTAIAIHSLFSLILLSGYFLFGSFIMCETRCTTEQAWLAAALAFSPILLILSMLSGFALLFSRASTARFIMVALPSACVMGIRIVDGFAG
ncbi:hypothetical protein [Sphingobium sp.]|uniref:hypothetical protein n=1 Tax=Sphingobium sp. TaxID=1912891 RepID=UPI003BB6D7D0